MKRWPEVLCNERGTALALALIILVIMTTLAVGLATMGGVESRISANQSASTRARILAESGIEYALLSLAGVPFQTKLSGTVTVAPERVLIPAGTTLPGLAAALGTFGVTIRNDISPGDNLLTGAGQAGCDTCASTETGTAGLDANNVVILTSTGIVAGATRVVVAVVQRGNLGVNAALTLPGVQADTTMDSPCNNPPSCSSLRNYSIDGRDWRRSDTLTPGELNPSKLGIATGSLVTQASVELGFDDIYKKNAVKGRDENTGAPGATGLNTIDYDTAPDALTTGKIKAFMTNLAANPTTQVIQSTEACQFPATSSPRNKPEGLHMSSTATPGSVTITNNCGGAEQINQTVNLGSPTNPQMIYFKGQFDPTSNFVGVGVEGSQPIQGYGILVVEDADMAFFQTGNFRWDGIVIVTGRNVSLAFKGSSNTEVRGAVIGSETNPLEPGGYFEFFNQTTGSMVLRASRENVDMALLALYNMRVSSYREKCSSGTAC